jgi:transcription antitermination factor NusA-like protein
MSANKRKFYVIKTTQVISADSKSDAILASQRKHGINANVISTEVEGTRVSAVEAREQASAPTVS